MLISLMLMEFGTPLGLVNVQLTIRTEPKYILSLGISLVLLSC